MTIVVAAQFLNSIGVFADCRVSYEQPFQPDDNLQKIYQVHDRMVLGFSGPLTGAYAVISEIAKNLKTYRRQPVAVNLLRDTQRWIKRKYREIPPVDRKDLSFMLATVEPRRETRSRYISSEGVDVPKPSWFPYRPEMHVIALEPSQSKPNELKNLQGKRGFCKIIGITNSKVRKAIKESLGKLYGLAYQYPDQAQRVLVDYITLVLLENEVTKVGGLLQAALLSKKGIKWFGYGSCGEYGDVVLEIENGRYMQRDNVEGRSVPLLTVWEHLQWGETQRGTAGVFTDPGLQEVVSRLRRMGEEQANE